MKKSTSYEKCRSTVVRLAVATGLGLSLAACSSQTPDAPINYDARMRSAAELVRLPHTFSEADLQNAAQRDDALETFLLEAEARYSDRFWIDTGSGVANDTSDGLAKAIMLRGLTYSGTAALGPRPQDGDIVLYLERYIARPPECGVWAEEAPGGENNTSSFWGCSNTRNLALMVANPRDLVAGTKGKPSTEAAVAALKREDRAAQTQAGLASILNAVAGRGAGQGGQGGGGNAGGGQQ